MMIQDAQKKRRDMLVVRAHDPVQHHLWILEVINELPLSRCFAHCFTTLQRAMFRVRSDTVEVEHHRRSPPSPSTRACAMNPRSLNLLP